MTCTGLSAMESRARARGQASYRVNLSDPRAIFSYMCVIPESDPNRPWRPLRIVRLRELGSQCLSWLRLAAGMALVKSKQSTDDN